MRFSHTDAETGKRQTTRNRRKETKKKQKNRRKQPKDKKQTTRNKRQQTKDTHTHTHTHTHLFVHNGVFQRPVNLNRQRHNKPRNGPNQHKEDDDHQHHVAEAAARECGGRKDHAGEQNERRGQQQASFQSGTTRTTGDGAAGRKVTTTSPHKPVVIKLVRQGGVGRPLHHLHHAFSDVVRVRRFQGGHELEGNTAPTNDVVSRVHWPPKKRKQNKYSD